MVLREGVKFWRNGDIEDVRMLCGLKPIRLLIEDLEYGSYLDVRAYLIIWFASVIRRRPRFLHGRNSTV